MAMRRSGKAECSAWLHAPVSLSNGNWILWRPGVDPILLLRGALRSFKTKRRLKIAKVFAPIPLLIVATVLIDSLLIRIPVQAWLGISFGLVLLISYTRKEWEKVERRSRVGRFDRFSWIDDMAGTQCITQRTAHTSPAAGRMVASLATIADSRALADGWIERGDVLQLHEIVWGSLSENHALNLAAQGELIDETAAILERTATETSRIDAKLRGLEKDAELAALRQKFQHRQSRAQQISADFEARLRFLKEQDRNG
jgi:hypothetical protein